MAEIATAAAISVLDKMIDFLMQAKQGRAHNDANSVKTLLQTMQAYLKDAEGSEGTEGFKDRVQQVRGVAYNIEDAYEEFMLHVPEHSHKHKISQFLHDIAHTVKDRKPLRRLASRMEAIKKDIEGIKGTDAFRIPASEEASSSGAAETPPEAYPALKEDELVGVDRPIAELLDHIWDETRHAVISVVGPRGSGKTTLIKEVYQRVKEGFGCHAWVPVRHSCQFILEKICAEMELPVSQGTDTTKKLHSFLQQKKYIIVLDGIRSKEEWHCISNALPDGHDGSRIIISTHNSDIASYCAKPPNYIYNVEALPWKETWELFCKKAFRNKECPKPLLEWSENILKRCEGLPLAIVAVGSLLSTKSQTPKEFKKLHDSLGSQLGSSAYLSVVGPQSYHRLSPNLKSCFLYFCNFPEDHSITRGRLIRLWIAERFVKETNGKTLEQVADEYLDDLVHMNLVLVNRRDFNGQARSCRVHNLVREFILSKSEKENFCTVFATPNTSSGEKTRRLSLHNCCIESLQSKNFCSVRSLFMFGKDSYSESMAEKLLSSFRLLRVLDLEDAPLEIFPKEVVNLTLLRYLSLRNTRIKTVHRKVKKLQNLVTLDLRQTAVTKLPFFELHKLLYLLVDSQDEHQDRVGAEVFSEIGRLTSLQKLSLIKANKKGRCIVKELEQLTELRKLGITELKKDDGKDLCKSIQQMKNLSSLYISATSTEEYLDLDGLSEHPKYLHQLYLRGRLQKVPPWISSLNSVAKICLKWSKLTDSPLQALKDLPSLKELQLSDAYTGSELEFKVGWFQELRVLEIENFTQLLTVVVEEGAMPELEKLILRRCNNLSMVPLGIDRLKNVKEFLLYDMPKQLIARLHKTTGEDSWMVDHIPVIKSVSTENGRLPRLQNLSRFAQN